MVDPPDGYVPEGWTPPEPASSNPGSSALGMTDFTPGEMAKTPQFYMIWVTFLFQQSPG